MLYKWASLSTLDVGYRDARGATYTLRCMEQFFYAISDVAGLVITSKGAQVDGTIRQANELGLLMESLNGASTFIPWTSVDTFVPAFGPEDTAGLGY